MSDLRTEVARAIRPDAFDDSKWEPESPGQALAQAYAYEDADAAIAIVVEACAKVVERQIPPAAGGSFSHTNSMRVVLYDALAALRALPAPQAHGNTDRG